MPKAIVVDGTARHVRGNSGRRYRATGAVRELGSDAVPRVDLTVTSAQHRPLPTICETFSVEAAERLAMDLLAAVAAARHAAAVRSA